MASRAIIEAFGNAHYDVTRYPAHVATLTDLVHQDRFVKLVGEYSNSSLLQRCSRFAVAALATFVIPFTILHLKEPRACRIVNTVSVYFDADKSSAKPPECDVGVHSSVGLSLIAVSLGVVYNAAVSLVMRFTLLFTTKIYSLYVYLVLKGFVHLRPHMEPVLFAMKKSVDPKLRNVFAVWRRLSHPAYIIAYWLVSIVFVLVSYASWEGQVTLGTCLFVILRKTYLPIVVRVLRAETILQEAVKIELCNRRCPDLSHLAMRCSRNERHVSDMWWRLFQLQKDVFTVSAAEVLLMIEYFESSEKGLDGNSWPIDWHDRLCITGNSHLRAVYIDDLNILLTLDNDSGDKQPILENADASEFLTECKARLDALRSSPA